MLNREFKVLIIDDNQNILEVMDAVLTNEGYKVKTIRQPNHFIAKIQEFLPDIIIIDYLLPHKTGSEIIEEIRCVDSLSNIPIIMISAHPKVNEVATNSGADGFLEKPFTIDELLMKINQYLY